MHVDSEGALRQWGHTMYTCEHQHTSKGPVWAPHLSQLWFNYISEFPQPCHLPNASPQKPTQAPSHSLKLARICMSHDVHIKQLVLFTQTPPGCWEKVKELRNSWVASMFLVTWLSGDEVTALLVFRATGFNGSWGAAQLIEILDTCKRFQNLTPGNGMISASKFREDAAVSYA